MTSPLSKWCLRNKLTKHSDARILLLAFVVGGMKYQRLECTIGSRLEIGMLNGVREAFTGETMGTETLEEWGKWAIERYGEDEGLKRVHRKSEDEWRYLMVPILLIPGLTTQGIRNEARKVTTRLVRGRIVIPWLLERG